MTLGMPKLVAAQGSLVSVPPKTRQSRRTDAACAAPPQVRLSIDNKPGCHDFPVHGCSFVFPSNKDVLPQPPPIASVIRICLLSLFFCAADISLATAACALFFLSCLKNSFPSSFLLPASSFDLAFKLHCPTPHSTNRHALIHIHDGATEQ